MTGIRSSKVQSKSSARDLYDWCEGMNVAFGVTVANVREMKPGKKVTSWDRDSGFFFSPKGCKRWARAQREPELTFENPDTGEKWVTGAGTLPVDYFREDLMAALAGKKPKASVPSAPPVPDDREQSGESSTSH